MLASLRRTREQIDHRRAHFAKLVEGGLSAGEKNQLDLAQSAQDMQRSAQSFQMMAGLMGSIPQLIIGVAAGSDFGGQHIGGALSAIGSMFSMQAGELSYQSNRAMTKAQWDRRMTDWRFQVAAAEKELGRIDRDIAVAELRVEIARPRGRQSRPAGVQRPRRRALHDGQVHLHGALRLDDRAALGLYFQTYQFAFDLAKRAERAYRHELAIAAEQDQPIIKYGYWDSLRKGLLAGERLAARPRQRLDVAYMDKDVREYELRKSISLAQLDPDALVELRETGECNFDVSELLFDLDHPGHYLRRVKSVRLTIPAVVGPYTSARREPPAREPTSTRTNTNTVGGYGEVGDDDGRFDYGYGAAASRSPPAAASPTVVCSTSTSETSATCRSSTRGRSARGSSRCQIRPRRPSSTIGRSPTSCPHRLHRSRRRLDGLAARRRSDTRPSTLLQDLAPRGRVPGSSPSTRRSPTSGRQFFDAVSWKRTG